MGRHRKHETGIEREVGPVVRYEAQGRNWSEPTRITLPKVNALSHVVDPPKPIRFAPTV